MSLVFTAIVGTACYFVGKYGLHGVITTITAEAAAIFHRTPKAPAKPADTSTTAK